MTWTLVDSNVLLDFIENDASWRPWSDLWMERALATGGLVINVVVISEVAASFADRLHLERALPRSLFRRDDIPFEAAYAAGLAHREYRRRGGGRERTLPDFLIGAHAKVMGFTLLTRDPRRYRQYFPDLDIIAPDSHP